MLTKIDSTIQNSCTKFAHNFQRLTGLTSFWIAKWGRFLCFCSVAIQFFNYFLKFLFVHTTLFDLTWGGVMAIILAYEGAVCDRADRQIRDGSQTLPVEIVWLRSYTENLWWRIIWICGFGLSFVTFAIQFSQLSHPLLDFIDRMGFPIGVLIFIYFVSVNPLPPGFHRTKVKLGVLKLAPVQVNQ